MSRWNSTSTARSGCDLDHGLAAGVFGQQRRRQRDIEDVVARRGGRGGPRSRAASASGRGSRRSSWRTSPGRSWCQVCDMFNTRPSLSMVWKVKGVSAGILARKLVSGSPVGSSTGPCHRGSSCAAGSRRGCAGARWRGCRNRAPLPTADPGPAADVAADGSIDRMRTAWMSLSAVLAGVGALRPPVGRGAVLRGVERVEPVETGARGATCRASVSLR